MRKLYYLILLLSSTGAFAQRQWVELGVKGGWGPNYLLNSNIIKDANIKSPYSFGHNGGLKFGYNFSESQGITVDLLYSGFNQTYKSDNDSMKWEKKVNLTHYNVPVLWRTFTELSYFEAGPQFSWLAGAKETYTSTFPGLEKHSYVNTDPASFNLNNIAAVVGFGTAIYGRDNFFVMIEFRSTYGFLDIYTHSGPYGDNFPYDLFPGYKLGQKTSSYKQSHMITGEFGIEVNYNFRSWR